MNRTALGALTLALAASGLCPAAGPTPANLQVSVTAIGVDLDDLYGIRTDDRAPVPMRGALALRLSPGEHDLVLVDLAPNCSVEGSDSVRVTITPGGRSGSV